MTVQVLGAASATTIIPVLGDCTAAIAGAVGVTLPDITANASVAANFGVSVGIDLPAVDADFMLAAQADLRVQPPSVSLDVSAGIAGSFNITIGQLNAFLALAAYLNGLRGSITATAFTGTVAGFSGEAGQMVSGAPSDSCFAVVLSASTNESIASLKAVFGLV